MQLDVHSLYRQPCRLFFFFFNDTATTEIYTLSLHDALPIYVRCERDGRRPAPRGGLCRRRGQGRGGARPPDAAAEARRRPDRKSTRLNSSHSQISYAVFCLKKKKEKTAPTTAPTLIQQPLEP